MRGVLGHDTLAKNRMVRPNRVRKFAQLYTSIRLAHTITFKLGNAYLRRRIREIRMTPTDGCRDVTDRWYGEVWPCGAARWSWPLWRPPQTLYDCCQESVAALSRVVNEASRSTRPRPSSGWPFITVPVVLVTMLIHTNDAILNLQR